MNVLERFLKYISIDTTSDSSKTNNPSTEGQRKLAKLLTYEMQELNLDNIYYDQDHCYVYGILKGDERLPKIGFISHLDTSENANGRNIKPNIVYNYNGSDIILNNNISISVEDNPDLKNHIGKTLITSDGNTLLGSDDKAGIAEIMGMLEYFSKTEKKHGDIFVCFTPDEEIGLGTLNFDMNYFNPDFAYTVDGSSLGEFSYENFNGATATININGVSTHCGEAKGKMINAVRIATVINSLLPLEIPENTDNYEGFFYLTEMSGNASTASMKYLIRDFDNDNFENRKQVLSKIVEELNKKYNNSIELNIKDTFHNMYEVMNNESNLIDTTLSAITNAGVKPEIVPIRGGTDGTDISFLGIPCPNLGTGGHNFHSVYEYVSLEDMEDVEKVLISIVDEFSKINNNHKVKIK